MSREKFSVILPCAGVGKRMKSEKNKVFLDLMGVPVVARAMQAFEVFEEVEEFIMVIRPGDEVDMRGILSKYHFSKPVKIVWGGQERQDSVYNGLMAVNTDVCNYVLIHDGARPLVTYETIRKTIDSLILRNAVCVGVPTKDTLKIVNSSEVVVETPDRSKYWNIQTPQGFRFDVIKSALDKAGEDKFLGTDDASLVERLGEEVQIVMGTYDNIKVTTPEDMAFSSVILERRKDSK